MLLTVLAGQAVRLPAEHSIAPESLPTTPPVTPFLLAALQNAPPQPTPVASTPAPLPVATSAAPSPNAAHDDAEPETDPAPGPPTPRHSSPSRPSKPAQGAPDPAIQPPTAPADLCAAGSRYGQLPTDLVQMCHRWIG